MPVEFISPESPRRAKSEVAAVWALVLDLDQGDGWEAVRSRLDAAAVGYFAYPSYFNGREKPQGSGTAEPARDRWRACIALDRPVVGSEWDLFYPLAADWLAGAENWDKAGSDASRLWYLPRFHDHAAFQYVDRSGLAAVAVDEVLALAPPPPKVVGEPKCSTTAPTVRKAVPGGNQPIWDQFNRNIGLDGFVRMLVEDGFHSPEVGSYDGRRQVRLTRPGKSGRDGCSVTITDGDVPFLHVFSSSVPALVACRNYTPYGYLVDVRCGGGM